MSQQQALVFLFLSPEIDARLGERGKQELSAQIKEWAERRIEGISPSVIEVVPSFAVQPVAGSVITGFVSFLLYPGVSTEVIKYMIVDATQSRIAHTIYDPIVMTMVNIDIGATFRIYPPKE